MSLSNFRPYENGSCVRHEESLKMTSSFDYVVIGIAVFFSLLNGSMVVLMFLNRKFGPIAAKQPYLLLLQYFAGLFWVFGNLMVNDTISVPQSVQAYGVFCFIRRFWIAYLFGFAAWISSFLTRFLRLYIVIIMAKKPRAPLLYVILFLLPLFLFCLIGLFLEGDRSCLWVIGETNQTSDNHLEIPGNEQEVFTIIRCSCSDSFAYIAAAIHIIYMLITLYFIIVLRNIRSSFNEYKELRLQVLAAVTIYIIGIGLSMGRVDNYITGRSALSLLYVLAVTLIQWITLLKPIYKTIFKREAYLEEFKAQLRNDANKHVESYTTSKKVHPISPKKEGDSENGKESKKESQLSITSSSFQKREIESTISLNEGRGSTYSLNDEAILSFEMEEKAKEKEGEKENGKEREPEKEKDLEKEKEKKGSSGRIHQSKGKNFSIIFEENSSPYLALEKRDGLDL